MAVNVHCSPHGAVGWSAVCDLSIFFDSNTYKQKGENLFKDYLLNNCLQNMFTNCMRTFRILNFCKNVHGLQEYQSGKPGIIRESNQASGVRRRIMRSTAI